MRMVDTKTPKTLAVSLRRQRAAQSPEPAAQAEAGHCSVRTRITAWIAGVVRRALPASLLGASTRLAHGAPSFTAVSLNAH